MVMPVNSMGIRIKPQSALAGWSQGVPLRDHTMQQISCKRFIVAHCSGVGSGDALEWGYETQTDTGTGRQTDREMGRQGDRGNERKL